MCRLTYVTVAALCYSCSLQNYLERWPAALNEAGRSVLLLMKRPTIMAVELHTFHLYHHYSLFMHNKLQYNWHGDYCECVQPAQLPVSTWGPRSGPPGTTSTIRSPPGPRRIQHISFLNYRSTTMNIRIIIFSKFERSSHDHFNTQYQHSSVRSEDNQCSGKTTF
jgi:hypothetical protein